MTGRIFFSTTIRAGLAMTALAGSVMVLGGCAGQHTATAVEAPAPETTVAADAAGADAATDAMAMNGADTAAAALADDVLAGFAPEPDIAPDRVVVNLQQLPGEITGLAPLGGGRVIAVACADGNIYQVEAASGRKLRILRGAVQPVTAVAASPNGRWVAGGVANGQVRLWESTVGACRHVLSGHIFSVRQVAFSPDGTALAAVAADGGLRWWNTAGWETRRSIGGRCFSDSAIAFAPDGRWLARAGDDATLRLHTGRTGRQRRVLEASGGLRALAFAPDGRTLAAGREDGGIDVWDLQSETILHTLRRHGGPVTSLVFSSDGQWLASAGTDLSVKLWRCATWQLQTTLGGHQRGPLQLTMGAGGRYLFSGGGEGTLKRWNLPALTAWAGPLLPQPGDAESGRSRLAAGGPPDLVVNRDEIRLEGTLRVIDASDRRLEMQVLAFTLPNGRTRSLIRPRTKVLSIGYGTAVHPLGAQTQAVPLYSLQTGAAITAIGPDTGSGAEMPARSIVLN